MLNQVIIQVDHVYINTIWIWIPTFNFKPQCILQKRIIIRIQMWEVFYFSSCKVLGNIDVRFWPDNTKWEMLLGKVVNTGYIYCILSKITEDKHGSLNSKPRIFWCRSLIFVLSLKKILYSHFEKYLKKTNKLSVPK